MATNDNWLDSVKKQIAQLRGTISDKDYKKFKLNTLLCIAERVAQFSNECAQCHMLQQDVTTLGQDVGNLVYSANIAGQRRYRKSMDKIVRHLEKQHKIVREGYYMGFMIAIGSGLGVALGAVMDNVGSGIPIGVGIGTAIGAFLDAKARREGRILCPRESSGGSKPAVIIVIILGLLVLLGLALFLYFSS